MLPWPELLVAANRFGLTPTQFWALSVFEWRALMGEGQGLDGARLGELCRDFPDIDVGLSSHGQGNLASITIPTGA